MIHTPVCDVLRIRHPIVLGGMAGATSVPLVAAVSNAGGLGTLGIARAPAEQIPRDIGAIREATKGPFGVNFLLFVARKPAIDAALDARPPVFSAAWARADQDLRALFGRAHEAGSQVMYMVGTVPEALRAKAAGADVIVAQGTEGGGHVGWMATMAVLPMIVDAVGSTPVIAAGGIADGRGLAAALALGAQGERIAAAPQLQTGGARQRRARHGVDGDSRHRGCQRLARRHGARPAQCLYRALGGPGVGTARTAIRGGYGLGTGSGDWRCGQCLSAHRAGCGADPRHPTRRRDRGTHRGRNGGAAEGSPAQAGAGGLSNSYGRVEPSRRTTACSRQGGCGTDTTGSRRGSGHRPCDVAPSRSVSAGA
jgi:hypothetical protein